MRRSASSPARTQGRAFQKPGPTCIVEAVEVQGKHVEVLWDDGLVLDTKLRSKSEWHVYRQGAPWRKSWDALCASIQTDDFVAQARAATDALFDAHGVPGQIVVD